ncbi:MAG: helix-hairpin-helix domain-containing protein [Acidimicrobiia bacterium]|nr:helix-hairpin-helix domain-containing protein [Acidimicrobiia bacterium]
MQPTIPQSDPTPPLGPAADSGVAESLHRLLIRLDGLRDRPGFSTAMAVVAGIGLALLWGLGQWDQPVAIESRIPSIEERVDVSSAGDDQAIEGSTSTPVASAGSAGDEVSAIVGGRLETESGVETTAVDTTSVVVHVSGEVARQGLVELPTGSRLADAIAAAGGETQLADVHQLNLATPLIDGMHIRVPRRGDSDQTTLPLVELPAVATSAAATVPAASPEPADARINVNQARAVELEQLPGVGPAIAAAIVSWREDNGPFHTVDDLLAVPGIGPAKLAAMQDRVAL